MNTETYTYLLDNPQQIRDEHLDGLQGVIEAYPYFQSARALQLKALKNRNSYQYNDALRKTAAYTTDRDILFEYITSEEFVQNSISEQIKQLDPSVKEIDVDVENVTEQVSVEIDRQLKAEMKKAEAILNPDLFERKLSSVESLVEETETPAAEKVLEVDKPLEFEKKDTHSFSEWLKLTRAVPIERTEKPDPDNEDARVRKFELIEKFIQEKPKIEPTRDSEKNKDLAKPFIQTPDTLMTETLARVYVQQKNYKKALQAYNILILKYPEKSGFFADQIRAIKKLINTEE
ncbi:hypothetical protein C5O00_07880 [Pukyongia salina]|uniref:Tetratricopeptide repeat protein n=1 Tax=Pukyongia salina TaxID=2094025 RepID=A0A2S0I0H3_9FLAO|nr:hypothetical protein C5O00_07880 [Pukyongia salina]